MAELDRKLEEILPKNIAGQTDDVSNSTQDWNASWTAATRSQTSRSTLRRVPSTGFHDDYAAHLEDTGADGAHDISRNEDNGTCSIGSPESIRVGPRVEEIEKNCHRACDDPDERDLESSPKSMSRQTTAKSGTSQAFQDPNMVSWSGPDDPENPKNWTLRRKWAAVAILSAFTL
jgi:hypothetical protein